MTPAIATLRGERAATVEASAVGRARLVREEPGRYYVAGRDCRVEVNHASAAAFDEFPRYDAGTRRPRRMQLAERPVRRRSAQVRGATPGRPAGEIRRQSPRGTPERTLQDAWRRSAARDTSLKASDGRWYQVVYSGRRGGSFGPDFVDAVLVRDDGARVTGDVEIHVRRNGWRAHGHDKDPRYNGVTFHAFLENTVGTGAVSADRREVRELRLAPLLGNKPRIKSRLESAAGPDVPVVEPLPLPLDLATAGEERFAARASGAELSMRHEGVDQALYLAVMECMGFPRNKRQFRELARRLPWDELISWSANGDVAGIEDLLLWAGGFGGKPEAAGRLNGKNAGLDATGRQAGQRAGTPDQGSGATRGALDRRGRPGACHDRDRHWFQDTPRRDSRVRSAGRRWKAFADRQRTGRGNSYQCRTPGIVRRGAAA